MARFMPGARISQAHGTMGPVDPASGARDATVFALYHPAAALRSPAVERESYDDVARIPTVLTTSRERRRADWLAEREAALAAAAPVAATSPVGPVGPVTGLAARDAARDIDPDDQLTFF
jgi:hypothetical protein